MAKDNCSCLTSLGTDNVTMTTLRGMAVSFNPGPLEDITVSVIGPPLISDHEMDQIHIYMNLILRGLIALAGIISNIINMVIFFRLGMKDSMSICLMTLSFTDFLVTFLGLAGTLCFVMEVYYPYGVIDPVAFHFIFVGWNRDIFYIISGWITTFLSVERCVCVVFPFKVKQIFTKGRSIIAMITIYLVILAIHAPVLASQWLVWGEIEVPKANHTFFKDQLVLAFATNRDDINIYIDIANGAVLPIPSQIIVFVSVLLLIYGLRASSQVRGVNSDFDSRKKQESKLSSKEGRLVKVVLFLAIILSVCNIPRFLGVYTKQIFPDVNIGRQYANLYVFLWNLAAIMAIFNSTVNILVYLIVNVNFRNRFWELFRFQQNEENDSSKTGQ